MRGNDPQPGAVPDGSDAGAFMDDEMRGGAGSTVIPDPDATDDTATQTESDAEEVDR